MASPIRQFRRLIRGTLLRIDIDRNNLLLSATGALLAMFSARLEHDGRYLAVAAATSVFLLAAVRTWRSLARRSQSLRPLLLEGEVLALRASAEILYRRPSIGDLRPGYGYLYVTSSRVILVHQANELSIPFNRIKQLSATKHGLILQTPCQLLTIVVRNPYLLLDMISENFTDDGG